MVIPYARDYTATTSGVTLKLVKCETCGTEYSYFMEREAAGTGTSMLFLDNEGAEERAASRANAELQKMLEQECDPVPCPACGWYQEPMVASLRASYRGWMIVVGAVLLIGCIVLAVATWVHWQLPGGRGAVTAWLGLGALTAGAVGGGLIALRRSLAAGYHPNSGPAEERRKIGRDRAMLKEQLEQWLKAQQQGPEQGSVLAAGPHDGRWDNSD